MGIAGSAGPLKSIIDLFGKMAAAIGMAFQTPVSEKLREEQTEMNVLAGAIMSANEGSKVRSGLISELQQKYPDYFGNLDKEKSKNEDIKKALEAVNKEYRNRIQQAIISEDLAKIEQKLTDNLKDQRTQNKGIEEDYRRLTHSSGENLTIWQKIKVLNQQTSSINSGTVS